MCDYINRQDAIDAFDGVKVDERDCTEYDIGYNDGIDFAISKLSVLPSAELPIKEKCCVCPHCENCDVNDDGTIKPTADVVPMDFYGSMSGNWFDKRKKELGYKGCKNCKNQIDVLRTCEWLEQGGDGNVHLICPRWEKRGDTDARNGNT